MGIFRARSVMVAVVAVMMAVVSVTEITETMMAVVTPMPPAVMVVVMVMPAVKAPIVVMPVTAVAPAMTPVAAVTPADLRGNGLSGDRRFHGIEPARRRAGRPPHQACQPQDGSDGANSPPRHFRSSPFLQSDRNVNSSSPRRFRMQTNE
jgi:hypothetical protein